MLPKWLRSLFYYVLPWLVLVVFLAYSYAQLTVSPYSGLNVNPESGEILEVLVENSELETHDFIRLRNTAEFDRDAFEQALRDRKPGEILELSVITPDGQAKDLDWVMPVRPSAGEVRTRLQMLWISGVFLFFGFLVTYRVPLHDRRWAALIAFDFVTALWILWGSFTFYPAWFSQELFAAALFFSLPVYLHLHWVFPRPVHRAPRFLFPSLYALAVLLTLVNLLVGLSRAYSYLSLAIGIVGSLILVVWHIRSHPDQRRDFLILSWAVLLILLPALLMALINAIIPLPWFGSAPLILMPVLPAAYYFVLQRRQPGGLGERSSRVVTVAIVYLIAVLVVAGGFIVAEAFGLVEPGSGFMVAMVPVLMAVLITTFLFPNIQKSVERRLMGINVPAERLLQTFAARLQTTLDLERLQEVWLEEVLPAFGIRQAALLWMPGSRQGSAAPAGRITQTQTPVFAAGVSPAGLPRPAELYTLAKQAGRVRLLDGGGTPPAPWGQLVLPLEFAGETLGLALFGSRSLDEEYNQRVIEALKSLLDQTALALQNIEQAEELRLFYKTNIDRQELERMRMARELHDEVLNQLTILMMYVDEHAAGPAFFNAHKAAVDRIREMITGLRPVVLNFGLAPALDQLAGEMAERAPGSLQVDFNLDGEPERYGEEIELHLYRIIQQALQNVSRHAQAACVRLSGHLRADEVELVVEDDGQGIDPANLDLKTLIAGKHFGIVGMLERAALIGARLEIVPRPGAGTRVRVLWRPPA